MSYYVCLKIDDYCMLILKFDKIGSTFCLQRKTTHTSCNLQRTIAWPMIIIFFVYYYYTVNNRTSKCDFSNYRICTKASLRRPVWYII